MLSICVITRGKYGIRLIENIRKNSAFKISAIDVPAALPDFIETPSEYLSSLHLDTSIFPVDLLITYILHPDLTPEIIRLAGEKGVGAVIIAGGSARAGDMAELQNISEKYHMHIEIHDICCAIEKCGDKNIDEFAAFFGIPRLKIITRHGKIEHVQVLRGAPCGSTWHMAQALSGVNIEDAPAKAGLLVQQYPCRAQRGIRSGIHKAAQLHKRAIETSISGCKP